MKKIIFFIAFLVEAAILQAQLYIPFGYDTLFVNNWRVRINANNSSFWDMMGSPKSEIPAGSGVNSIFVGNFWIGGLDSAGNLYVSADRYYDGGNGCFTPGPFANTYDSAFYAKYNRVWKINKSDIEYHINHWNDPGYTMPEAIATWPANGDTTNGELPILAPFIDVNGNGIYDPQNGDYPRIHGDQAIYYILNDKNCTDGSLNPMGIEIHVMYYAFDDTGVLGNTFFVHYDVINLSSNIYHDVYFGLNTDADLGNASDDYIGCDSTQNLYFFYNGDNYDDGSTGYGYFPPALGVLFLNNTFYSFMSFSNGGGAQSDPTTSQEYYNYMRAIWKDGTHLHFGGDGYSDGPDAHFMYPVNSGWSEISAGNAPGDRRGVGSVYMGDITHEQCFTVDAAYVWARDTVDSSAYSSVELLLQQIPAVTQLYSQMDLDPNCGYLIGIPDNPYFEHEYLNIYPNPASDIVHLKTNLKNYTISLYSQSGQKILEEKNIKELNTSNLSSGFYLIKITSGTKTAWRKLIVE